MVKLTWNELENRVYTHGLDRGVLYPKTTTGEGVPWNGLQTVNISPSGGTSTGYFLEGRRYINETALEEFGATLTAYTYPDEFENIGGMGSNGRGSVYQQQDRMAFDLSYRTIIGDGNSSQKGYFIHLLYNVRAEPTSYTMTSDGSGGTPASMAWKLSSLPILVPGRRPVSHIILDTRDFSAKVMTRINDILYGTAYSRSRMLMPIDVINILGDWNPLQIKTRDATGFHELLYNDRHDLSGNPLSGIYTLHEDSRLSESDVSGIYII